MREKSVDPRKRGWDESFRRKLDRAELGNKGLEEEWIAFKGKVKKVMKDIEKESEEKERRL